ncbi:Uncharacterised protein [Sphingobacterium daejeonense]|nr:Uncharacterised protein [Sphingobacterium daejeonense]
MLPLHMYFLCLKIEDKKPIPNRPIAKRIAVNKAPAFTGLQLILTSGKTLKITANKINVIPNVNKKFMPSININCHVWKETQ